MINNKNIIILLNMNTILEIESLTIFSNEILSMIFGYTNNITNDTSYDDEETLLSLRSCCRNFKEIIDFEFKPCERIIVCCAHNLVWSLSLLLKKQPKSQDLKLGLQTAARHGNIHIVKTLLKHGADTIANREEAMYEAMVGGHSNVLKELYSPEIDIVKFYRELITSPNDIDLLDTLMDLTTKCNYVNLLAKNYSTNILNVHGVQFHLLLTLKSAIVEDEVGAGEESSYYFLIKAILQILESATLSPDMKFNIGECTSLPIFKLVENHIKTYCPLEEYNRFMSATIKSFIDNLEDYNKFHPSQELFDYIRPMNKFDWSMKIYYMDLTHDLGSMSHRLADYNVPREIIAYYRGNHNVCNLYGEVIPRVDLNY